MKIISRELITDDTYREILDVETHHDHEIIEDENGTLRWKANRDTEICRDNISLNDLIPLFWSLGINKNHEIYRLLYRNMGYSLYGYWEIFYWEANNEEAHLYNPPVNNDVDPINPNEVIYLSSQLEAISARLNEIAIDAKQHIKIKESEGQNDEE